MILFLAALSSWEKTFAIKALASSVFFEDNNDWNFFIVFLSCCFIFKFLLCLFLSARFLFKDVLRLGMLVSFEKITTELTLP